MNVWQFIKSGIRWTENVCPARVYLELIMRNSDNLIMLVIGLHRAHERCRFDLLGDGSKGGRQGQKI
jgi:hypothetical protein